MILVTNPLLVCLSVCLPACLSVCLSVCLSIYLSDCQFYNYVLLKFFLQKRNKYNIFGSDFLVAVILSLSLPTECCKNTALKRVSFCVITPSEMHATGNSVYTSLLSIMRLSGVVFQVWAISCSTR